MQTLFQDLRYGLRMLAKNPGFTAIAVLTLALGIGANTAMFSIIDAVMLRPLPFPQPQGLVKVWTRFTGIGLPNDRNWISAPEARDIGELNKSFSGVAAFTDASFNVTVQANPERIEGVAVSPSLFALLGVRARLGRVFASEEAQPGRDNVLLLGYGLWQRRFGSDPHIIGRTLVANGKPYVVIGVLPSGFDYPNQAEMWAPLAFTAEDLSPDNRGNHGYELLARLRPNVSLAQARADMELVGKMMTERSRDYPYKAYNFTLTLTPLLEETVGDVKSSLWILMGGVGFVLLVACANIAGLSLVRASARQRETSIRLALGASPRRLARQLITESLLFGVLGGTVGLLLARWGLQALVALSRTAIPRVANTSIDGWVLAFTTVLALGTGVLVGLGPAFQAARGMPYETLKEGGHGQPGAPAGAPSRRLRPLLVVGETAVALVLLTGTGLLLKSLVRLLGVDPGFRAVSVLTMRVSLPEEEYRKPEQVRAFYHDLLDRIQQLPGVKAAGAVNILPLSGHSNSGTITVDSQAVPADQTTPEADWRPVTPGYFKALEISLVAGRYFDDRDTDSSPPVAIIDESMARTYWPNEDPIGKRIKQGGRESTAPWRAVVGVVRHVRYRTLEARSRVEFYWPQAQRPYNTLSLAIRTERDPMALAPTIAKQIHAIDPDLPAYQVRTMLEVTRDSVAQRRVMLILLGLFAAAALVLAAVGIYGTVSYSVAQRTHEIGVRMALGAEARHVLRMVLKQGIALALGGIGLGLLGSLALTWLLSAMLFGVRPTDPLTFTSVSVLLTAVALLASYIPARRATQVDPLVALRYE
jgi:putative ABC transport system permease protein